MTEADIRFSGEIGDFVLQVDAELRDAAEYTARAAPGPSAYTPLAHDVHILGEVLWVIKRA